MDGRVRQSWEGADDSAVVEIEKPAITFADVGGMDALKEEIRLKIREGSFSEWSQEMLARRQPEPGRERAARGETGERQQKPKNARPATPRAAAASVDEVGPVESERDDDFDFSEYDDE